MENNLQWKNTFDGRQPLMEGDPRWKTIFVERLTKYTSTLKLNIEGTLDLFANSNLWVPVKGNMALDVRCLNNSSSNVCISNH